MKNLDDVKYFLYLEDSYKKIIEMEKNDKDEPLLERAYKLVLEDLYNNLKIENDSNFSFNLEIFVKMMDNYIKIHETNKYQYEN